MWVVHVCVHVCLLESVCRLHLGGVPSCSWCVYMPPMTESFWSTCDVPHVHRPNRYDDLQRDSQGRSLKGLLGSRDSSENPSNCALLTGK